MKTIILSLTMLMLLISATVAEESTCPADRAGKLGLTPFEQFHHILAPVWHNSWPAKDYDALIAAGPKFAELFTSIKSLDPKLKSDARRATYSKHLAVFGEKVKAFATAAEAGDTEKVYEIMPDLHDAFEMTASAALPISYPQIDGFIITVNLISESHLPRNNSEGIIGSTETLALKSTGLTAESIPTELSDQSTAILADFANWKKVIKDMKNCCDSKDWKGYQKHLTALSDSLTKFIETYL